MASYSLQQWVQQAARILLCHLWTCWPVLHSPRSFSLFAEKRRIFTLIQTAEEKEENEHEVVLHQHQIREGFQCLECPANIFNCS